MKKLCMGMLCIAGILSAQKLPDSRADSLIVPDKFKYNIFAASVGPATRLTVRDNGDVYVMLSEFVDGKSIAALRDADGDGFAEQIEYFGNRTGTDIQFFEGYLYFSTERAIFRYKLGTGLVPYGEPEGIVRGIDALLREYNLQHLNPDKAFTICPDGNLYINVAAPDNACQEFPGKPESTGVDPCPYVEFSAGIWLFDAMQPDQLFDLDGYHYASGIRHCAALCWNENLHDLFGVQQGRDQLASLWPYKYSVDQDADLPAEEFLRIKDGNNFGWPYCYYDPDFQQRVLGPEYGGDGEIIGRCMNYNTPEMVFAAHAGAIDMLFYTSDVFPEKYQHGAFIAFQGSDAIAPAPQRGYSIEFLPVHGDTIATQSEPFMQGFAGVCNVYGTQDARFRPAGIAQGMNGELYVSDSVLGRVWRIIYKK